MDPTRSPNPRTFDPTRFLPDPATEFASATAPDPSARQNYIFGAGRRVCQGMHVAERSLFLAVSRLLWGFNILPMPGRLPDAEDLIGAVTIQPAPFEVRLEARSVGRGDVMRVGWENVREGYLNGDMQWRSVPEGMAFSTWMPDLEGEKV